MTATMRAVDTDPIADLVAAIHRGDASLMEWSLKHAWALAAAAPHDPGRDVVALAWRASERPRAMAHMLDWLGRGGPDALALCLARVVVRTVAGHTLRTPGDPAMHAALGVSSWEAPRELGVELSDGPHDYREAVTLATRAGGTDAVLSAFEQAHWRAYQRALRAAQAEAIRREWPTVPTLVELRARLRDRPR